VILRYGYRGVKYRGYFRGVFGRDRCYLSILKRGEFIILISPFLKLYFSNLSFYINTPVF